MEGLQQTGRRGHGATGGCGPHRSFYLRRTTANLLTDIVVFGGFDSSINLNSKGWNSQTHREFPGKCESSNLRRGKNSREIGRKCLLKQENGRSRAPAVSAAIRREVIGSVDDTVGNPHRTQISQLELFELILLSKLDKQLPVERFEATVSQSAVPSPLLF